MNTPLVYGHMYHMIHARKIKSHKINSHEINFPRGQLPIKVVRELVWLTWWELTSWELISWEPVSVMHLSMVCPTWHSWDRCSRKKEGDLLSESSPRCWFFSWDTCMFSSVVFKCLGKFLVNFTDTHISLLDTVYNREIWVFVGKYVGRQGELTCSIRTCKFPFYLSPSFRYWREAYH